MISLFKPKDTPLQAKARLLWVSCAAAGFAVVLAACGGGGGGGGGGKDQNGTTPGQNQNNNLSSSATYFGPISGFGSVIVNGTKFDDNSAKVMLDDDDSASSTKDLRLGMVVEIKGERNSNGASGKALSIAGSSYAKGPITEVDTVANQINLLGLTVNVTPTTVFDGVPGLASLEPNDFIEVHGLPDNAGNVRATRIEKKDGDGEIRLVGIVKNANASSFSLYGNTVNFSSEKLEKIDGAISNGMRVRVKGHLIDTNAIVASKVRQISLTPSIKSGEQTEVQGIVTHFTSADFFEVNGLKVKVAANARREGTLALGAKVEVEGYINDGILVADKVELKKEDGEDAEDIQIKSAISSIDIAAKTLTLRNGTITAKWTGATEFDAKTLPQGASGLGVNKVVEVRGTIDGQVVALTRVKLED